MSNLLSVVKGSFGECGAGVHSSWTSHTSSLFLALKTELGPSTARRALYHWPISAVHLLLKTITNIVFFLLIYRGMQKLESLCSDLIASFVNWSSGLFQNWNCLCGFQDFPICIICGFLSTQHAFSSKLLTDDEEVTDKGMASLPYLTSLSHLIDKHQLWSIAYDKRLTFSDIVKSHGFYILSPIQPSSNVLTTCDIR